MGHPGADRRRGHGHHPGQRRRHAQVRRPAHTRFLGTEPGNGKALGLDERWAYNIVKQLGNYGEIFERNVGKNSPMKLERGMNRLYRDGGLMYPYVFN